MRKVIFLLLLIFTFVLPCTSKEYSAQKELEKIEKERQICLDTGVGMINCEYKAINKYEIEIEKLLKKFKKVFSQSQYEILVKTQKLWNEFYKQNDILLDSTLGHCDATSIHLISVQQGLNVIKNRFIELYKLYDLYVFFKKDGYYD